MKEAAFMSELEKLLLVIVLILLATMSVHAQKVSVGADPAVDLTKYKSYAWSNVASANPLANQTVVSAVDTELAAKGLTRVDTNAELTVVVFGSTESDIHVSNPSWAPSLNSIATGVAVGSQNFLITKGTLVVDLLDTKTNNSVWRGHATDTLDRGPTGDKIKDAKTVEKPIRNAVKKMFKQFPHPNRK
jgi:hypothetical protein